MTTMTSPQPPQFLKMLAHDVRWQLLTALSLSDYKVQELVQRLGKSQNLVSYHLRQLRQQALVKERHSSADGRDVYYSLDLSRIEALFAASEAALHPALGAGDGEAEESPSAVPPARILFLCTHNSARSQLAEGIMRANGGRLVEVFSAGSHPTGIHPLAVRAAEALNIDISRQESKLMDQFVGDSFDYVITVCDKVREVCPVFPGDPQKIHWSFPDPAAVTGTEDEKYRAFLQTARELTTRIGYLLMMIEKAAQEQR